MVTGGLVPGWVYGGEGSSEDREVVLPEGNVK